MEASIRQPDAAIILEVTTACAAADSQRIECARL